MADSETEPKVRNIVNLWTVLSLWKGRTHGYELMNEIEGAMGKRPSASQIYPFLKKLEDKGLVEVEETGTRGKKVYSLTDQGRAFVDSKLEMFSEIVSATVEKDLTTCAHCGCRVYEGGHLEKVNGEELKFCCRHCAESYRKAVED